MNNETNNNNNNNDVDFIKFWDDEVVQCHVGNEISVISNYFKSKGVKIINYVDIGANVGKYYDLLTLNGFLIGVSIMDEAAPDLYNYMVKKFEGKSNCKIYNFALSDIDGAVNFESHIETYKDRVPNDRSINLGVAKMPNTEYNESNSGAKVEVINGKKFFELYVDEYKNDINLIKIDTENRDYNILGSITPYVKTMTNKPYVILEHNYHNDIPYEQAKSIYDTFRSECEYDGLEFDELGSSVFLIPKK
jgi:hypothetical protein